MNLDFLDRVWPYVKGLARDYRVEISYALFGLLAALVRAAGVTVVSGTTGLKFSFGRATRLCEPGFHPLLPFLQVVRVVPTRSRTIDLSTQRVTTLDGLVYSVDANLVYRVVDVRKALIEIDQLERGMLQMLGLGVQEVLRLRDRGSMRVSDRLDHDLRERLERRLEPWGVSIESAGFTTITPTAETLRLTQLSVLGATRADSLGRLEAGGVARRQALALLGPRGRFASRGQVLRERALTRRRRRRLRTVLGLRDRELLELLEELDARRRSRGRRKRGSPPDGGRAGSEQPARGGAPARRTQAAGRAKRARRAG